MSVSGVGFDGKKNSGGYGGSDGYKLLMDGSDFHRI